MNTPWGKAQEVVKLDKGVSWVSTAGHGGFMVGVGAAKRLLSPEAQAEGEQWGSYLSFEEDCDYAIVLWEHPEYAEKLGMKSVSGLFSHLSTWKPLYLIARGIDPGADEFSKWQDWQREQFMRAEHNGDLIVSASGDWASWVPKGKVGVTTADNKRYLVPDADYTALVGPKFLSRIQHEEVAA